MKSWIGFITFIICWVLMCQGVLLMAQGIWYGYLMVAPGGILMASGATLLMEFIIKS